MANQNIDTQFNFQGFTTLKKDLREAVELYQKMLQSGTATTEQIEAQAKVVARLKDEIDDANDATAALTGAGRIQAMGRAVTAVAGGFTALQGVIALAGNESEDLQKTMVKLQAALSISAGLSQLEDLGNAFKNASRAIGLTTLATQAYTFVTNGATLATKALRAALVTTGAGAIVVGLGLVVNKLMEIAEAGKSAKNNTDDLAETIKNLGQQGTTLQGLYNSQVTGVLNTTKLAVEKGLKSTFIAYKDGTTAMVSLNEEGFKNLENILLDYQRTSNEATLASLEFAAEVEKEKQQKIIDESTKTINEINKKFEEDLKRRRGIADKRLEIDRNNIVAEEELKRQAAKNAITILELQLDEEKAARTQSLTQITNDLKALQKLQKDMADGKKEEALKEKKRLDDELKKRIELSQKIGEIAREEVLKRESDLTRELEAIDDSYEEKLRLAVGNEALTNQLMESLRKERLAKTEEYNNKEIQSEKEKADEILNEEKRLQQERLKLIDFTEEAINRATRREILEIKRSKKSTIEKEKEIQQAEESRFAALRNLYKMYGLDVLQIEEMITAKVEEEAKKRTDAIAAGFQAVLQLGSTLTQGLIDLDNIRTQNIINNENLAEAERERVAKESFERQKKLQIAMATIDFAKAVASIYAQWPKFDGGFMMYAAIAQALLTAGVTIAKIKAVEYQSPISGSATDNQGPAGSKFASGGLLMGKSHDQGGIKTAIGELEGGEFLINKIAAERFMPILEKINSFGQQPTERMAKSETPIFKTYVVASEMSSELQKRKKMKKLAQL